MAADESDDASASWAPSPNFWPATDPNHPRLPITHIVVHGTAGVYPGCLEWLLSPDSQASVHYLVTRDGTTIQLVREDSSAWGNGIIESGSIFSKPPNPNQHTISVEHERNTANDSPITPAQQAASTALIRDLRMRHGNLPLIPHSAIEPISRAHCPGDGFPLAQIDHDSSISIVPTRPWPFICLQRDTRWGTHDLGNAPDASIGDFGCYVACDAMVSAYYGHPATPLTLNAALLARGIYVANVEGYKDLMPDDALAHLYSDVQAVGIHDWADVPADLSVLAALSKDPTLTTVLEVDFDGDPSTGISPHFVVLDSCDGQRVWVLDPWYGDGHHADDLSKNFGRNIRQTIQKAVVYKGTPKPAPRPIPTPPQPTAPTRYLVLTDMMARSAPNLAAVRFPIQMVHTGAVLRATGPFTPHWVQVVAGGRNVWLLRKNLKGL